MSFISSLVYSTMGIGIVVALVACLQIIRFKRDKCPVGYREIGKDEILPVGCHVRMNMRTGKNYIKIEEDK